MDVLSILKAAYHAFVARVGETAEPRGSKNWKPKPSPPNNTLRLSIALWEEDIDAAWTVAHQGICDPTLLITLADKLEKDRADDAISLYRRSRLWAVAMIARNCM